MKEGKITLSQEQLKTLTVINRFIDKSISRQQAAELLGLSTRQITRLKKGVLTSGAQSLIHKNTGRKPVHSVSDELKETVLKIYSRPEFSNANFLHFKDILSADFGIQLSYSALSSILKNAGFESPKKKKIRHRTHRRKRKPHPGQLIQIDATPYEWFGGNIKYALHGAIDDATGQVVGLFLTQNECLYGYLETMRQCCSDFGIPQTVYSDNHTIFRSPKTGKLTVDELIAGKTVHLTQFGRSLHELGIEALTLFSQRLLRQRGGLNVYGSHCRAGSLLSSQNVGLLLCQKQTVFWKQSTGNFSIRGLPLSRKQSLFLSLPQKI